MRTQIKSGRLCVLGLVAFLVGCFIGCTGQQPSDNVEPAKKATTSPDQNRDTVKDDTVKKGMMETGMMEKGMMKKDLQENDTKEPNSGDSLP